MAKPVIDTDSPTILAMQAGDRQAFAAFVRRHHRFVRGAVFAVLGDADRVDDVSQQVWATVWQRIDSLRDPQRWRPWLYRLARNAAVDAGREASRRRSHEITAPAAPRIAGSNGSPDGAMQDEEMRNAVWSAVRGLPAKYREPFVLRHVQDWSYRQISEVMDMPVDTVETRLVRARRLLREALTGRVVSS